MYFNTFWVVWFACLVVGIWASYKHLHAKRDATLQDAVTLYGIAVVPVLNLFIPVILMLAVVSAVWEGMADVKLNRAKPIVRKSEHEEI